MYGAVRKSCRKVFGVINVKTKRGFAVQVDSVRSDGSVNRGKITSNLYAKRVHTF